MACGSLITEMAAGKTLAEARIHSESRRDCGVDAGGLPKASGHAAQLAVDALRAVVEAIKRDA